MWILWFLVKLQRVWFNGFTDEVGHRTTLVLWADYNVIQCIIYLTSGTFRETKKFCKSKNISKQIKLSCLLRDIGFQANITIRYTDGLYLEFRNYKSKIWIRCLMNYGRLFVIKLHFRNIQQALWITTHKQWMYLCGHYFETCIVCYSKDKTLFLTNRKSKGRPYGSEMNEKLYKCQSYLIY